MRRRSRWTLVGAVGSLAVATMATTQFGAPLQADEGDTAVALSATTAAAANTAPSVSDNGAVVAFEVTSGTTQRIDILDRVTGAVGSVPTDGARLPGISGNGCVVGHLVPATEAVDLVVFDRCTDTNIPVTSAPGISIAAAGAPALSADGSVLAWSTGTEVLAFTRTDDLYELTASFDATSPADTSVTGSDVDVSADGTTVAFLAGPGDDAFVPSPANVYVADLDAEPVNDPASADDEAADPDAADPDAADPDAADPDAADPDAADPDAADPDATVTSTGEATETAERTLTDAADGDLQTVGSEQAVGTSVVVELVSATADGSPATGASSSPSLDAAGDVVVFTSTSRDLAAVQTFDVNELGPSFVTIVERSVGSAVVAPDGLNSQLAAGGRHIVYETTNEMRMLTWLDDGEEGAASPFGRVVDDLVVDSIDGDGSADFGAGVSVAGPQVSAHGRYVVLDSDNGQDFVADEQFHNSTNVFAAEIAPVLEGGALDLGEAAAGTVLTGDVVFVNTGRSGIELSELDLTSQLTAAANTCEGLINAGARCTVSLSATMPDSLDLQGSVVVSSTTWDRATFLIDVIGGRPPTATVATTTTTTTTTTTPATTTTRPRTTQPTTTRPRTTTTTTTVPASALVSVSPAVVEFAPTIVAAGRRIVAITLDNGSNASVPIGTSSLSGDGAFAIVADTCGGASLSPGATCTIEVDFAPQATGTISGVLSLDVGSNRVVSVPLGGVGAAAPVLQVVPAVVSEGQVVAVFGGGFPAGAVVELEAGDQLGDVQTMTIDETGRFVTNVVVLPNTPTGALDVTVIGQPELFGDTVAEVLVSNDANRSTAATLGGLGPAVNR